MQATLDQRKLQLLISIELWLEQLSRGRVIQVINVGDKIIHRAASRTVIPLSTISNASHLACESDGTTLRDIVLLTPLDARSKQIDSLSFITDAGVEFLKVQAVFQGTTLDQVSIGNVWVIGDHAVCKSKPEFDLRIDLGRAKEDDIAQAFAGTVFAGYGV